jgi:hypothetical protein
VICGDHTERRTKADARPDRASEPAGNPFHQSTDDGRKRINVINDCVRSQRFLPFVPNMSVTTNGGCGTVVPSRSE